MNECEILHGKVEDHLRLWIFVVKYQEKVSKKLGKVGEAVPSGGGG